MTVLFQGAEMASFTPSDSTVKETTDSTLYDTNFARCSITCNASTNYAEGTPSASATDYWIHFDMASTQLSDGTSTIRLSLYDSSGNERIRFKYGDGSTHLIGLDYWNGSAFVSAGTFSLDMGMLVQTFDIRVVCNSGSGSIDVYVAGSNRLSASVSTSSITNLKKFRFFGGTASTLPLNTRFSQVIVADEPTVGWRLVTRYANGAGATNDWTGGYTEIDETVYFDADFINSATANQVELFTNTGQGMTGYSVRSVAVSARAKRGSTGPQNIRMALRSAGTTYFSASDIALGLGYAPVQTVWETDPATAADFLTSAISTLQFGVKSIT